METFKNKWVETYKASIISVGVMLLLLIAAVICHLFEWRDAPFQFLAACLGAGVTVIITNLLLVEQTKQQKSLMETEKDQDLESAKKTEQYKEKLRIYQSFLEHLFEVVKDRELTTDEKIAMQFQTAYLAIHTEPKHIETISANVGEVLKCLCSTDEVYKVDDLQKALFNIVRQFRDELYEGEVKEDVDALEKTLKNFVNAYSAVETTDAQEKVVLPEQTAIQNDQPTIWKEACDRWKNKDWEISQNGETIQLYRPNDREIHVQFGFWRGHYYMQAKYNTVVDFSRTLKYEFKGSRTYGLWWNHIKNTEYYNLAEGEFYSKFNQSETMQKTLVEWFDKLIERIERQDISVRREAELMNKIDRKEYEDAGWNFWFYELGTFVCDYKNEVSGQPFVDTFNDTESGKIVIRFGNRKNSLDVQKQLLRKIGLDENNVRNSDNRTDYASFEMGTPDSIISEKLAELLKKINN